MLFGQGPLRREHRRDLSLNVPYTKGQKVMGNSPSKGAISRRDCGQIMSEERKREREGKNGKRKKEKKK